jgi:hypothetical protein
LIGFVYILTGNSSDKLEELVGKTKVVMVSLQLTPRIRRNETPLGQFLIQPTSLCTTGLPSCKENIHPNPSIQNPKKKNPVI